MNTWQAIATFGVAAIAFDAIWATTARAKGYAYSKGMWVSFIIYMLAGFVAAQTGNFINGVISGAGVAFIEATIGWWVSWLIGPGRLPDTISKDARPRAIFNAIVIVTLTGAFFGFLGALVKTLL
jgi:hypothetical protein